MRAFLFVALASLTACTLLESKDGLEGAPLDGDAGPPASGALDAEAGDGPLVDATSARGTGNEGGAVPSTDDSGVDSSLPPSSAGDAATLGPSPLFTGRVSPLGIGVHGGTICWVEGDTLRSIACGPTTGGGASAVSIAASQSNDAFVEDAFDVALDDANYYWSNGPKNQVVKKPRGGGASGQFFTGDNHVSYIFVEGATVWTTDYVSGAASGNVSYGPYAGDQSQLVYPSEAQAAGVGTYAGSVYWGTPTEIRIGPEPGNATIAQVATAGKVTGLAVDGAGNAYFLVGNRDVYRLPMGAGAPVLVYSPGGNAFGDSDLALDDGAIYWSEHDTGRIMRLAK